MLEKSVLQSDSEKRGKGTLNLCKKQTRKKIHGKMKLTSKDHRQIMLGFKLNKSKIDKYEINE